MRLVTSSHLALIAAVFSGGITANLLPAQAEVRPQAMPPVAIKTAIPQPVEAATNHPADLLPANAAGIIVIDAKSASWNQLTRFGLFPQDFSAPSLLFEFLAPGVNFHTDIQPWIGEKFAFGYLETGVMVVIAPVQKADLVPQFLDRAIAQKDKPVKTEQYKDIRILSWEPEQLTLGDATSLEKPDGAATEPEPPGKPTETEPNAASEPPIKPIVMPGWAIAYLPKGYVVGTEKSENIKAIIDQLDQPRFSRTEAFQKLTQHPQYSQALVAGVGDYSKFIPAFTGPETNPKDPDTQVPPTFPQSPFPGIPQLPIDPIALSKSLAAIGDAYKDFNGLLWAEPNGLRIQSTVTRKTPLPPQPAIPSTPSNILSQVPANSYGFVSAKEGVAGLAKSLNLDTGIPSDDGKSTVLNPAVQIFAAPLQLFSQTLLGVDAKDITPWMDQEIALFAFPTKQGFLSSKFQVDLSLGAVIQTSDRTLAENTINKVTRHIQEQNPQAIQSQSKQINGTEVISLNTIGNAKTPSQNILSYSWIKPDTVLIQSGIDPLLIPKPWQPLADSPNFQEAIAPLPKSDAGYFYLNGSSSTAFIFNSLIPRFFGPAAASNPFIDSIRTTVSSIRSIAGNSRNESSQIVSDGFILLNRNRQPQLKTATDWVKAAEAQTNPAWRIANYSQALQLNPSNAALYLARGQARAQNRDFSGSINDFGRVMQLAPTDGKLLNAVYQHRAQSYLATFQYNQAIADLSRNIQRKVNPANSYTDRATAYLAIGNYKAAFDDATQAIQRQPSKVSYQQRCLAQARLGDFQAAAVDCQRASTTTNPVAMNSASTTPNTLTHNTQIFDQSTDDRYRLESTQCYVNAGLGQTNAIKRCDAAITGQPNNPIHHEHQGLAYALLDNKPAAIKSFQAAIDRFKQQGDRVGVDRVTRILETLK
ncbi:DUF3352 domain-containing protein [filamentous cyanobacterium LEGE 11480]|uniref:DUF3352 domain-containing protein n=1 Tax=Romeriopsis navalis LEGE 11480 TaxID=2777977 RepID=A0A928VTX3_9CYAN|nr:DUF3352 domain-containing protein [Romeriopsis navalis]MBE9032159.1 DUF3352 domain-containing protein [Romeriopsis navalis LEGE 11480]